MNEPEEYRLRWRGRETGPYPLDEINRQLDEHEIGMGHEIFYRGNWVSLDEFFAAQRPPPPPPPLIREKTGPLRVTAPAAGNPPVPRSRAVPAAPAPAGPPRRRWIFAVLAIFTGFLGLHNLYARQWLTGLLQLLLTIATVLMGFGIIASWLWAMVEAVVVHKDGNGIDMI